MPHALIVYGSTEGQTRKIAGALQDRLREHGLDASLVSGDEAPAKVEPGRYAAIVVAASIHQGRHPKSIAAFVRRHKQALDSGPAAFLSVSLSAAGDEGERADAQRCLDEFLAETDWRPPIAAIVAGALRYRDYGCIKRWFMRRLMEQAGHETDTSRNHEYTDWAQVRQLADRIAEAARPAS